VPHQSGQDRQSFALSIREFIDARWKAPPPLIGTEDDCILPAFGLLLYIAKGGKGKTTSSLDAALHLASGVSWLGFEVSRPLRILFIENEGPRAPFRRKLERRIEHWSHPLKGEIFIYDEDWGQARLDESGFVERLQAFDAALEWAAMGSGADTEKARASTLVDSTAGEVAGRAESPTSAPVAQLVRAAAF
jgi:hypothetical protein